MKHTHDLKHHAKKARLFFPFIIISLLLFGVVVSLLAVQQQQDIRQRAASPNPTSHDCTVAQEPFASTSAEQVMYEQINIYREQQGLQPLAWSNLLKIAANWMSQDMLANERLNHIDSLNRDVATRIPDCGYPLPAIFGENIDNGATDVSTILNSWKHSQPHNDNLLNPQFTQIGISLATGSAVTQSYWTVDFAGASQSASITINPSLTQPTSPSATISPSIIASPSAKVTPTVTKTPTPTKKLTPVPTKKITSPPTPTPTINYGYIPNPLDTQLSVSAQVSGIGFGGNKSPKNTTRQVEILIYDQNNQQVMNKTGNLRYDGNAFTGVVHLGKLPNGTYYVKIANPYALQALVEPQFQVLKNDQLNKLPIVNLIQGDLNKNNSLTIEDYNLALNCFQNKPCVNKNAVDFNDDGVINIADYNLFLQNFLLYRGD